MLFLVYTKHLLIYQFAFTVNVWKDPIGAPYTQEIKWAHTWDFKHWSTELAGCKYHVCCISYLLSAGGVWSAQLDGSKICVCLFSYFASANNVKKRLPLVSSHWGIQAGTCECQFFALIKFACDSILITATRILSFVDLVIISTEFKQHYILHGTQKHLLDEMDHLPVYKIID